MASVYGIKANSCFNLQDYFHVADGLLQNIVHYIFCRGGVRVGV